MDNNADPWETAKKIGLYFDGVFPIDGKRAFWGKWQTRARNSPEGIATYAKEFAGRNYAINLKTRFVLDVDVVGIDALREELTVIFEILGPFTLGFVVVTGKRRYHIFCDSRGREIPTQKLTDKTQIKGPVGYVVGPGSWHPETSRQYAICDQEGHNDPLVLAQLTDETLDRLAAKRARRTDDDIVTFDLETGDVLDLEHLPCIRKLMLHGAPKDQDYYHANHTIARYVISAGLTDGDGADIAAEMALHTSHEHPTGKDTHDKIYNFRSCMSSARNNPEANQFACEYVRGSRELISGNVCKGCAHKGKVPIETPDKVRVRAMWELKYGDPFQYAMDTYHLLHASDDEPGKVTLLSIADQSVLNANGIFPLATGGSGKGKTSGKYAIIWLVPPKYVFKQSWSDKSLFYEEPPPESILFFDDKTLSEGMEELLRTVMDDFQSDKIHTTVRDGKKLTLKIPPRCMVMFTNVDSALDLQTTNRTVNVTVDESPGADDGAHHIKVKLGKLGAPRYPESFEVLVCREIFRIIKEELGPFTVVVPYLDLIHWPEKSNRRNFDIFVDFIRGFAAFRCMQRQTRDGVVFADVDHDFKDAVALYGKLSKTQTSKLSERDWLVLQAIFDNGKRATLKELVRMLQDNGLSYDTIRNILVGRKPGSGLLHKVPGLSQTANGSEYVFELPSNFNILAMYESGSLISLDEDEAKAIDVNTLPLWKPFDTLTSFDSDLTKVCQKSENDKKVSVDDIDDLIETYKQQLLQHHSTLTTNQERVANVSRSTKIDSKGDDMSRSLQKSVKVSNVPVSKNGRDEEYARNENCDSIGDIELCQTVVKGVSKKTAFDNLKAKGYQEHPPRALVLEALDSLPIHRLSTGTPLDTTHPHTDDDFLWFFESELKLFRYEDGRQKYGCGTDDDVGIEICKRVCEERCIHLENVVQAWRRLRYDKAIVSELDAIFNRTPRGRANGPKLVE